MKKFIASIVLLAVAALTASAQTYGTTTLSVPTQIEAQTGSNTTAVIDVRKNDNFAVQIRAQGANSSTANVSIGIVPSLDGVTYDNSNTRTFTFPLNNTTVVNTSTNWTSGAYGYFKLIYVTNAAAVNVTNLQIKVALKPGK